MNFPTAPEMRCATSWLFVEKVQYIVLDLIVPAPAGGSAVASAAAMACHHLRARSSPAAASAIRESSHAVRPLNHHHLRLPAHRMPWGHEGWEQLLAMRLRHLAAACLAYQYWQIRWRAFAPRLLGR
jgi:hypothetical protein